MFFNLSNLLYYFFFIGYALRTILFLSLMLQFCDIFLQLAIINHLTTYYNFLALTIRRNCFVCYSSCTPVCMSMVAEISRSTHATIIKSRTIRSCRFASDKDWKLATTMIFDMQFHSRAFFVFTRAHFRFADGGHRKNTRVFVNHREGKIFKKIRIVRFFLSYEQIRWNSVRFAFYMPTTNNCYCYNRKIPKFSLLLLSIRIINHS